MADNDLTSLKLLQLPLGYFGALRVHLEPVVELTPESKAQVVDHATATKLALEGTHKNVVNAVPCQLTWVIATDRIQNTVDHPRKTVVEPSGSRFRVREWVNNAARDLQVDAFELGLVGTGRLGYRLKLDLIGATPVECGVLQSGIEVKLAADVWFAAAPSPADGSPSKVSVKPSGMLVGKPYKVTAKIAGGWKGSNAKLHLASYSHHDHQEVNGTSHEFEWKVGDLQNETEWRVGIAEDGHVLSYPSGYPEGGQHRVGWSITLSKPDPTNAKKQQTLVVPVQEVGEFAHPTLTALSLAFVPSKTAVPEREGQDAAEDLVLTGAFSGFDPSYVVPVETELYGRFSSAPPDENRPLRYEVMRSFHELPTSVMLLRPDAGLELAQVFDVPAGSRPANLDQHGQLESVLVTGDEFCRSGLGGVRDLELFGTVRFPPSLTGSRASVSFQRIAGFSPGEGQAGFAPMRDGKLVVPVLGIAVCSNLLSLAGTSGRLEGPAYDSIDVLALAACIWTEAQDNKDDATRAKEMLYVGGVIQNRVLYRYNGNDRLLKIVLDPSQFSAFNEEGKYPALKTALVSEDPAKVEAWKGSLDELQRKRFDECLEIAKRLVQDPSTNPWINEPEVRHYLSPGALTRPIPDWATAFGVTKMPVPGIADHRFRFLRGVKGGAHKP